MLIARKVKHINNNLFGYRDIYIARGCSLRRIQPLASKIAFEFLMNLRVTSLSKQSGIECLVFFYLNISFTYKYCAKYQTGGRERFGDFLHTVTLMRTYP